jgi:2-desacetyl-2-hydroxyethyl bacteriochlorophyllide A dehydrogenase
MATTDYHQIVFTGPSQAEYLDSPGLEWVGKEKPAPGDGRPAHAAPGRGEILIRTDHTLISPGTELAWFSAMQREVAGDAFTYPVYTGYCHSGTVVACGEGVQAFAEGDRVVTGAGHVSHVRVATSRELEVDHSDLRRPIGTVPAEVPAALAPFAKIGEIAATAVRIADFSLGEKVLILGLGMVGNLAAQLFQLAGADVLAADLSDFRIEKARACGVRRVVNSGATDLQKEVDEWTHGLGADVTVESAGNSRLLLQSVHYTRRLGDIIVLGTPRKAHELNPTPDLWQAHMKGITIKGALRCLFYPLHESRLSRRSVERDLHEVLRLMAAGSLQVAPLHTHTFLPTECQSAYSDLMEARDTAIGATFDWAGAGRAGAGAAGGAGAGS